MPRQNRVTPSGEVVAVPERGTFMGNRGVLHDAQGRIKRPWHLRRWIVCVLEFRGRKRQVMKPGHYTELFFLDEATALAAGHRPCAECRRPRFNAFREAWEKAAPAKTGSGLSTATQIDHRLHAERIAADGSKRSFVTVLDELPDGVFVGAAAFGNQAHLLWDGYLLRWSSAGYGKRRPRPLGTTVEVLTPKSTVAAIRAGYVPFVHPSAA